MAAKKTAAKSAKKSSAKAGNQPAESKVVAATGTATRSGASNRGAAIEKALVDAINAAAAKGITDPDKVSEMMKAAREDMRIQFAKEDARAAAQAAAEAGKTVLG